MKTEAQTITMYTRKMLAAFAGLQVQRTRLYQIDCDPGLHVPSRFKSVSDATRITATRKETALRLVRKYNDNRFDRLKRWEEHEAVQQKMDALRKKAFPKILLETDGVLPVQWNGDMLQLVWGKEKKVLATIGVGLTRFVRSLGWRGSSVPFDHVSLEVKDGYETKATTYDMNRKAGLNVDKIVQTLRNRLTLERNREKEAREKSKNTKTLRERVSSTLEQIGAIENDNHYVRDWNGRGGSTYPYYQANRKDGCLKVEVSATSTADAPLLHYQIYTKLTDDQMRKLAQVLASYHAQNAEVKS